MTLRRFDDFMAEKKQDVLLLFFRYQGTEQIKPEVSIQEHLAWFDEKQVSYEQLTDFKKTLKYGDICYYINFESPDDPLITEYSNKFENEKFLSLKRNEYQMYLYSFVTWYITGGNLYFEGKNDENTDNG
jgi:hypothetical protein